MRLLAWIGLAVVVLGALAVVIADHLLTGMVNRDPLRAQIDEAVDGAVGRDVSWKVLGVTLVPPSLVIEGGAVAGASDDAPPLLESERIELRLALLPLLARTVVVDSLHVLRAGLRLVLTPDGLELPDLGAGDEAAEPEAVDGAGDAPAVAIRRIVLEDARLLFDDRTASPARGIELVDVDVEIRGHSLEEPFDVTVAVAQEGGGRATLRGTAGLSHDLDLELTLDAFPLLPLDPYLAAADEVRGLVTGTVTIVGPPEAPTRLVGDVEVAQARLRFQETLVEGPVSAHVEHSGPWNAPRGRFRIDATRARASLAGVYEKAPGRPATLQGRLTRRNGGLGFDDVELRIENAEARGEVDLGGRLHARLALAPVELDRWPALLTPLAGYELSGGIESERWEVWNEPVQMEGRLGVQQVRVTGPKGRSFTVEGELIGTGDAIRSQGLVLESGGQVLPIEIEVTDLDSAWRYRVRTAGEQLDANQLLTGVAGKPDTLYGPLALDSDLTGSLAGEVGLMRALGGRTRFQITPGRLKGISILEATLQQLDKLRAPGPLAGLLRPRGGASAALSDYYRDDFLDLSANLTLADGFAATRDLRLLAQGYEFRMEGRIGLEDLGLDARGEIKLGEELTQSIARLFGVERIPLVKPLVIPIPRLRGTVTDPKPEPDFKDLLRLLTRNLPAAQGVRKLLRGLDGALQPPSPAP